MQVMLEVSEIGPNWKSIEETSDKISNYIKKGGNSGSVSVESEATSAVDTVRRSPGTPTSIPCPVSELRKDIDDVAAAAIGLEEWDSLFPNGDGALMPWIMSDPDNPVLVEFEGNADLGVIDQVSNRAAGAGSGSVSGSISPTIGFDVNPNQLFGGGGGGGAGGGGLFQFPPPLGGGGNQMMNQQQNHRFGNPSFVLSPTTLGSYCQQLEQFQPQAKRHNTGVVLDPNLMQVGKNPFFDPGRHELVAQQMMQTGNYSFQSQEQGVRDQLFKAADMIQTGNFSLAQEILARLNQQLSITAKPPVIRAALYVKEALQMLLQLSNPVASPPPKMLTPYDIVHKMNAYKVFSEVSPITQFINFTCTQAILEALDDVDAIHIVDFDIGCGAQWASLIQELPLRKRGAPSLHITAVVSPTTHAFELALIRENLVQFANDTNIAFQLQIVNMDSFDPSSSSFPNFRTSEDVCVAVSIPIWASSTRPSLLSPILRFINQLSPKIVVSLDRGFDRCDVPFPQHIIHSLESCTNLLESLDGLNVSPDIVSKIEKFFVQPRIENTVLGRIHVPDKMPHWKNLFASAGLVPLQFSNFTETQADYVVKRTPGGGFLVEKRQASLVLSWQRRELVAVSAWRC